MSHADMSVLTSRSGSGWLKVTPVGIRRMLNWVKYTYGDLPIYITENGVSDLNGALEDDYRIDFYKHYINNVLKGNSHYRRFLQHPEVNWLNITYIFLFPFS
jgi:beta-glucosidase/6-phospho-beta-glucosidase/beta-galactosidase